jgi:hypothetical protein
MKPDLSATIGWQVDNPWDVLGVVVIVISILLFLGFVVKMIGNGKLKPKVVKEYFFPSKPQKRDYPKQEPATEYKPMPMLPEKYAREVLVLVERSIDHHERLDEILKDTLTRQMRVFEEQEVSIVSIFKRGFTDILKATSTASDVVPHAKKMFSGVVRELMREMNDHYRSWCLTNHFYEMTDEERKKYVSDKIGVAFHLANGHFDDEWNIPGNKIDRDDLHYIEDHYGDEFKDVIVGIFKRAFKASEDCIRKTNEEKAKYSAYVMAVSGYDPYDITRC